MNNKKKYIVIVFILVLILIGIFLFLNFNNKRELPLIIPLEQNYNQNKIESQSIILVEEKKENSPTALDIKNIKVTLNVLDKTYNVNIKEGETVYDAMTNIQNVKENNFSFKSKEYPSLGIFINEINGIKGGSGKYWIYYVNDKKASVGVSNYVLKSGDIISWKQE